VTWLTIKWAYAEGERRRHPAGNSCGAAGSASTREGEIALYYAGGQYMGPGSSPQLWDFQRDRCGHRAQLTEAVGHRVRLHYTEHPGVPTTCLAETRYFVDKVTVTDEAPGTGPAMTPTRCLPHPAASAPPAAKP